ncbi:hypothetical protein ACSWVZ_003848 [Photobacterium damselae]
MNESEFKIKWKRSIKYNIVKYKFFSPIIIILNIIYTYYLTFKLCGLTRRNIFVFTNGLFFLDLEKHKTSKIILKDNVFIELGRFSNNRSSRIRIGKNATLRLDGPLSIGEDNFIDIRDNALLVIGGYSLTGITCSSKLICVKKIYIGGGVIISWGCFISDSSHHSINGNIKTGSIIIEDHVWINNDVIIFPNVKIKKECVVMARSIVNKTFHDENILIGGTPAITIKNNVYWK